MMGPPPAGSRATLKSQLLATSTAVTRNLSCPVRVPSPNSSDVLPMPSEMTSPGHGCPSVPDPLYPSRRHAPLYSNAMTWSGSGVQVRLAYRKWVSPGCAQTGDATAPRDAAAWDAAACDAEAIRDSSTTTRRTFMRLPLLDATGPAQDGPARRASRTLVGAGRRNQGWSEEAGPVEVLFLLLLQRPCSPP